ncbi:MAG: HAMP domain-containing histidine kinase [Candidatus Obscuribacterales bacterium]|nr:HAMP domain-containing histidine kinase [Candidatus Obscuribacterales bacterium]
MTYRENNKYKRLSILHKGLIIIAIPLLFELFFVFVLLHLLDESNSIISKEIESQDKIVCVETLIKEIADSTTSSVLYNVTRNEGLRKRNENSRAKLRKNATKLIRLCEKDPTERDAALRLNRSAISWMEQQDRALVSMPQARLSAFFAIPGFAEVQQLLVMRPEGSTRVILEREQKLQSAQPRLRRQAIWRIQLLMLFGLTVHVTITIFLAYSFAIYVSQRLDNVLKNTLKLGARLPLEPPLRGTDEIADLDYALHKTASEILNFEKFKEQLVAMVSHELRTPLTSVQGTLTLAEAGALGAFSDKSLSEINKAQENIEMLIELINNLLLLERMEAGSQVMKQNTLSLSRLVHKVIEEKREKFKIKNIQLKLDASNDGPVRDHGQEDFYLVGDDEKLTLAVGIIFDTAILRAPEGSVVEVTLKIDQERLELKITDKGSILSAQQAHNFFERTRDVDDNEQGKARILLLSLTKSIVAAHNGFISVNSDRQTTTQTLRLPHKRSHSV